MHIRALVGSASFVFLLMGLPLAQGGEQHKPAASSRTPCKVAVHITEDAERQLGGALHKGAMPKRTMPKRAMRHIKKTSKMQHPHMVHKATHGGHFFMVNNKAHHIELAYSKKCGFQLFFYNAFTQPISARRFRAFIITLPQGDEGPPEVIRILAPSPDGSILQARVGSGLKLPVNVNLHVKFPESDEPKLFNIFIRKKKR